MAENQNDNSGEEWEEEENEDVCIINLYCLFVFFWRKLINTN